MRERFPGEIITHTARAEAEETVDKNLRYAQILEILSNREMTAKEIAVEMCRKHYTPTAERNFVSPRLTELGRKGIVEPIAKKKCQFTGKSVSVWRAI